ncbi:deoxyribose-phosphate aldolase [Coprinopsis marcescibilis]|uniref:deoxyribose-phosphate aldolase n=1 Tax=Coprinopsis marcescibilis TaxID=230819 RepID=A0A5C3KD22_COPMA|nr:deoxyribose-phosphate aldolase [Coprinopsis marcescibilis]
MAPELQGLQSQWSDEAWGSFIQLKIATTIPELNSDLSPELAPLSSVSNAQDPRFPLSIDHTLLKPDATPDHVDKLCDEAIRHHFKSCCVNGLYVRRVASKLRGSSTITCAVVGFPLGAGSAVAKSQEARQAILDGAQEIDTVIPVGLLLATSPSYSEVYHHLRTIIDACGPVPVKVIIETALLPDQESKIAAAVLSTEAGATFVKTSTGFSGGGATVADVKLLRLATKYRAPDVKIKASGGVRTLEDCIQMFNAGAERIGTSAGASLMKANTSDPDAAKPNSKDSY